MKNKTPVPPKKRPNGPQTKGEFPVKVGRPVKQGGENPAKRSGRKK